MSRLLRFNDQIVVEIDAAPSLAPVSSNAAERVGQELESSAGILSKVVLAVAQPIREVINSGHISSATVEMGVGFSLEGGLIVRALGVEGNFKITVKIDK